MLSMPDSHVYQVLSGTCAEYVKEERLKVQLAVMSQLSISGLVLCILIANMCITRDQKSDYAPGVLCWASYQYSHLFGSVWWFLMSMYLISRDASIVCGDRLSGEVAYIQLIAANYQLGARLGASQWYTIVPGPANSNLAEQCCHHWRGRKGILRGGGSFSI
jgi:hypothetical protein